MDDKEINILRNALYSKYHELKKKIDNSKYSEANILDLTSKEFSEEILKAESKFQSLCELEERKGIAMNNLNEAWDDILIKLKSLQGK